MQDVADHGSGWRSDDSDYLRKEWKLPLARCVEQPFGGQGLAPAFEQRKQRPLARQLHAIDYDLIFGSPRISGELPSRDHLGSIFRPEREHRRARPPNDGIDAGRIVLQREVAMARGMALESGYLAADTHLSEGIFDGALERSRKLADGQWRRIVAGGDVR